MAESTSSLRSVFRTIFLIAAIIIFILGFFGVPFPALRMLCLGLACMAAAFLL